MVGRDEAGLIDAAVPPRHDAEAQRVSTGAAIGALEVGQRHAVAEGVRPVRHGADEGELVEQVGGDTCHVAGEGGLVWHDVLLGS